LLLDEEQEANTIKRKLVRRGEKGSWGARSELVDNRLNFIAVLECLGIHLMLFCIKGKMSILYAIK
jgi:hypothetical protein